MIERELRGARVVFSTREGGVSEGPYESLNLGILTDDDQSRVTENRRRLAESVGLDAGQVALGVQVHGADFREWSEPPAAPGFDVPGGRREDLDRVDAHLTRVPDLGLLILGADCLPVALAGPGLVAMLHCGWRGLAAGIVERVAAQFDEPPAAAIGPGIGRCCYEVGPEVLAHFSHLPDVADGRMLDLRAVARHELSAAGVLEIEDVDLCTSCRGDLFFSHRRDGGVTGRQCGMVWRTG